MNQREVVNAQPTPALKSALTPAPGRLLQRTGAPGVAGVCDACPRKRLNVQRSATNTTRVGHVPPIVHDVLHSPGQPLDVGTRSLMESRFGHNFGNVRVHTGDHAAQSARAVNALAYTVGQDIVFDEGRYQPATPGGQRLLAHELTHTVQQRGLQTYAADVTIDHGAESRYEREAEHAADLVASLHSAPAITQQPIASLLSRAVAKPSLNEDAQSALASLDAEEIPADVANVDPSLRRFRLKTPFPLPAEKGQVKSIWDERAAAGGLESTVDVATKTPRSALKQATPSPDKKRAFWLTKVGWSQDAVEENWQKVTKKVTGKPSSRFPQVDGETGDMDHIVELQIGGVNIKENFQLLAPSQNRSSGAQIRGFLSNTAAAIYQAIQATDKNAAQEIRYITLHFDSVSGGTTACDPRWTFCRIEQAAQSVGGVAADKSTEGEDVERYPIKAGFSTDILIGAADDKKRTKPVDILKSKFTENKAAATLIPGVLLTHLHRAASAKKNDTISAVLDAGEGSKTKLPIVVREGKHDPISYDVQDDGKLSLKTKNPNIQFLYRYLSEGVINKLAYDEAQGLSGRGTLRPSLPFLNRMTFGIEFGRDYFRITSGLDPDKIKSPVPGGKITEAKLAMELWPEFNPSGNLAFEYAKGDKKLLDAAITIGKDDQGLMAKGDLFAYIPGVDKADGKVLYSGGAWSGGAEIESTQIKLPYIKSGKAIVGFSEKTGINAGGKFDLELPGGNTATVRLEYVRSRWLFIGEGTFKVPRIDPVHAHIQYDGETETLTAKGKTGFTLYNFKGTLQATYIAKSGSEGQVTGTGSVELNKGKVIGRVEVTLHRNGKFTGKGHVKYQFSEKLTAGAGVELDEKERLKFSGDLVITSFELFKGFGDNKQLFSLDMSIPIPGASIGGVGLKAGIGGGVAVGYQVGPGVIAPLIFSAKFYPLEEKSDLALGVSGTVSIPASAWLSANIYGKIVLDVFIAEVGSKIVLTGTIKLAGGLFIPFKATYEQGKIEAKLTPEIKAALLLGLALDLTVWAQAGIGRLSVKTEKTWNLARREVNTGLQFSLKAPIEYSTDRGLKVPSLDEVEMKKPEITTEKMTNIVRQLVSGAEVKEREV